MNMVVEYAKLPSNSSKALCEGVATLLKTTVEDLFPEFYNNHYTECVTDHGDLQSFQRVPWSQQFEPGKKYTQPGSVTKCSTCKKVIPCEGPNRPTEKMPAWVCRALANELPCRLGESGCFGKGIACHSCQQAHACRDFPNRRRRRGGG